MHTWHGLRQPLQRELLKSSDKNFLKIDSAIELNSDFELITVT